MPLESQDAWETGWMQGSGLLYSSQMGWLLEHSGGQPSTYQAFGSGAAYPLSPGVHAASELTSWACTQAPCSGRVATKTSRVPHRGV